MGTSFEKEINWEISVDAFSWHWYEESFWKGMFGDKILNDTVSFGNELGVGGNES